MFDPKTLEILDKICVLQALFCLLNQGRVRWRGHVADMEEGKHVYLILVEKGERNRLNGVDVGGRIL